jgi:flagellin
MAMSINTNVQSLNAQRNLATSQHSLSTTMQRLSSGLRVNSAKDDAAGLAIAERMNAQVRGMNVAVRNANDGVSMAQTAEGALSKVTDALQRMRELAVQARNGTNGAKDQVSLNKEFVELGKEIDRVIKGADFNGKKILSTDSGAINFQVGANTSANDSITVTTSNLGTNADITGITSASIGSDATTALDATALATVISNLDTALDTVNS